MKYIKIALSLVIIGLFYTLYEIVQEPLRFGDIKSGRYKAVQGRMIDIRQAQLAYKAVNGLFASDFDKLINCVKNDSFLVVKTIGNPDDTNIVTYYDTSFLAINDSLFPAPYPIDSLAYIPHGRGKKFMINAGSIVKAKITVQVYEILAPDSLFMQDLYSSYSDYIDRNHSLQLGSMLEATTSGNWE